jgi:hypothetical protein
VEAKADLATDKMERVELQVAKAVPEAAEAGFAAVEVEAEAVAVTEEEAAVLVDSRSAAEAADLERRPRAVTCLIRCRIPPSMRRLTR